MLVLIVLLDIFLQAQVENCLKIFLLPLPKMTKKRKRDGTKFAFPGSCISFDLLLLINRCYNLQMTLSMVPWNLSTALYVLLDPIPLVLVRGTLLPAVELACFC